MDENQQSPSAQPVSGGKDMMPIIIIVVVIVLVFGGFLLLRGSNKSKQAENVNQETQTQETRGPESNKVQQEGSSETTTKEGTTKEVIVSGQNYSFTPSEIRVSEGDTVKVIFQNTGGMHDFTIDEFKAKTSVIQGGQTAEVTFVAQKRGTFEFYCSVGNHRQLGMRGTLIVE